MKTQVLDPPGGTFGHPLRDERRSRDSTALFLLNAPLRSRDLHGHERDDSGPDRFGRRSSTPTPTPGSTRSSSTSGAASTIKNRRAWQPSHLRDLDGTTQPGTPGAR